MTIQASSGLAFDAIVFGELEPGRWMAGSEGFRRYKSAHPDRLNETRRDGRFILRSLTEQTARSGSIATGCPMGSLTRPLRRSISRPVMR